jgi:hypothetical protein
MIVDGSASLEILAAFDHWPIPLDDDLGVRPDFPNALVPQTQMIARDGLRTRAPGTLADPCFPPRSR